jgi:hypothetical protein
VRYNTTIIFETWHDADPQKDSGVNDHPCFVIGNGWPPDGSADAGGDNTIEYNTFVHRGETACLVFTDLGSGAVMPTSNVINHNLYYNTRADGRVFNFQSDNGELTKGTVYRITEDLNAGVLYEQNGLGTLTYPLANATSRELILPDHKVILPAAMATGTWLAGVRVADDIPLPVSPDWGAVQDREYPGRKTAVSGVL